LLLHDIARPHTAQATVANISYLRFEYLLHPPHSTHLAPSDFHVFRALKDELSGRKFGSDEVQEAVHDRLCQQPEDFFQGGFML
jgi:histone-lysine N-methyltransferase SETMAR